MSKFIRGNIVRITPNASLAFPAGTLFIVRNVIPYKDLKEDIRKKLEYAKPDPDTNIYYVTDNRGRGNFVPEYRPGIAGDGTHWVQCCEAASPAEETLMILIDEMREVRWELRGGRRRGRGDEIVSDVTTAE